MKLALGFGSLVFAVVFCGALGACTTTNASQPYETCSGACDNGTACSAANVTTDGFQGTFCTVTCQTAADCPPDGTAYGPACVVVAGASEGQCYAGCPSGSSSECPFAETCGTSSGVNFCVP
jgi:hypothetical protein